MDLWPARRCTDEPRVAIRCCDVHAVTRISTSCTPGRVWMTAPQRHLDPIPLLLRDGVLSLAVPAEPIGASA